MLIETIVVELVVHIEHDQYETTNPDGQTGDVQNGNQEMFPHMAEGDLEVMFYHDLDVYGRINQSVCQDY
jgi:hypothetical protein